MVTRIVLRMLSVMFVCSTLFLIKHDKHDAETDKLLAIIDSVARQALTSFHSESPVCDRSLNDELSLAKALSLSQKSVTPPASSICDALRAKSVLFIGPETTYRLHTLLLSALSPQSTCPAPSSCTFHHVCHPPKNHTQRQRYVLPPTPRELADTNSSLIRFALSSSLSPKAHNEPVVDSATGVRVRETAWADKARRADVLVLHRAPEPAPASTYDGTAAGNWTFLDDRLGLFGGTSGGTAREKIVRAASTATLARYLPSVLASLRSLRSAKGMKHKLVFWHDAWYAGSADDPWGLYYNAQVAMHKRLLPDILACYGVVFLDSASDGRLFPRDSEQGQDILRSLVGGMTRILEDHT